MLGDMFAASTAGLLFGLSLIVSIGPQNAYILQQGAAGRYVTTVVLLCLSADIILIAAGTAGAGAIVAGNRWLLTVVRIGGAAFILSYAALASRRAWSAERAHRSGTDAPLTRAAAPGRTSVITTCLAFTWLNPWVYVDTVVLLGTVANAHPGKQWWFAGGAMVASTVWFLGLGYAARVFGPWLRRPRASQVMDIVVAVLMLVTALRLLLAG
jgi:L-lysine exporter family protein LysE/ArgO